MNSVNYLKSINYSKAIKIIQQEAEAHQLEVEQIDIKTAINRVNAENVLSTLDIPEFDCSRMDGYAINYEFYHSNEGGDMELNQPVYAGDPGVVGDCYELATPVMTGAVLPLEANTVVIKEHALVYGNKVKFEQSIHKYDHVRKAGSDIKKNQVVLRQHKVISIGDLGVLSSVGISGIKVYKKIKVALMMTGDELVLPGQTLQKGQIYDSNSLMLTVAFEQLGCDVDILESLPDTPESVSKRLIELKQKNYDLVVTVGGVSMGDKDWLPSALLENGEIIFHKTRIKPGFPMLFGKLGSGLFFGLPGNPVSAFATMFQYIYPAILSMNKLSRKSPVNWQAKLVQDVAKSHMRREFVRGRYNMTHSGGLEVSVCGGQQSSRIQSLAEANCFIVLNESQQDLKLGEMVMIQPFDQLNSLDG